MICPECGTERGSEQLWPCQHAVRDKDICIECRHAIHGAMILAGVNRDMREKLDRELVTFEKWKATARSPSPMRHGEDDGKTT